MAVIKTMRPSLATDVESDLNVDSWPAWARVWHIWTVVMPHRLINGSIVWGRVWRRHDGRSWISKRLVGLEEIY